MTLHLFGKKKHASLHDDFLLRQSNNFFDEEKYTKRLTLPQKLFFALSATKKPLFLFSITLVLLAGSSLIFSAHNKSTQFIKQSSQAVLGAQTSQFNLQGSIVFSIPAEFNEDITANKGLTVEGDTTLNGNVIIKGKSLDLGNGTLTASNVLYGIKAGAGLTLSTGQNPTITNAGVTSFQGQTGGVTLTAGNGIAIDGTTISNTQASQNTFGTISDGINSFSAGSTNDTVTFSAGSGVTISTDISNKKLTFSATGAGLSGLTTNGVMYATSPTAITSLTPGISGYILESNGTGTPPSWISTSSLTNAGVTSLNGTTNQVNVSAATGDITLSLPQNIAITSTPTFAGSILTGASALVLQNASPVVTLGTTGTNSTLTIQDAESTPNTLFSLQDLGTSGKITVNTIAATNIGGYTLTGAISGSGNPTITGIGNLTASGTIQFSGLSNGILHATGGNGTVSSSPVALGSDVSGVLPVGNGGFGANLSSGAAIGDLLYANSTTSFARLSDVGVGSCLISEGTGVAPNWGNCGTNFWQLASGALAPANITNDLLVGGNSTSSAKFQVSGTNGNIAATGTLTGLIGLTSSGTVDFTGLSTGILHSTSGVLSAAAVDLGTTDITGTLAVGRGGTGTNTFTTNGILYGNGTGAIQVTGQGGSGDVLTANISGVPVWSTLSVSGGSGGNCSNCLVSNPTTNQIINPSGNITGLSVAQTSTSSPTSDIFNITNNAGTTKYLQVDSNGNLSVGGQVSFTNSSSTKIGTNIANNWTLNGNMLNNRRSITITNTDSTNALPANYEVTVQLTGATATDVCNNTRTDSNDLRISYGTSTEIARNVTRNCTTSITITFLLQANIAVGASDTYYIYYNNPNLSTSAPTYTSSTQLIDNADAVGNFTTTDPTYTPISQDTSTKQEGTGSVKIAVTGGSAGISYPSSTGADGTLDLSLGGGAGGCTGTGLSWNSGTSTCTITVATKSTYNFTTVNIPSGTTLTINPGTVTGTTPVVQLLATGTVSIAGTINLDNLGYAGAGGNNAPGSGPGAGGGGGGGAGYGGAGTSGYIGATAGTTYTGLNYGSGGGGSQFAGSGNNGGGAIQITTAGNMTIGGTISANGTSSGCLGADCTGGGSGGGIELQANSLTVTGTIRTNGGNGAVYDGSHWGGSGGGGRIWLDYLNTVSTTGSTITATGGSAGSQTASNGVILTQHAATSINQSVYTTKTAMDLSTYGAICFYVRTDTLTGQYVQFGFGKSAITENLSNITINSANTWQEACANIGSLSVAARQGITVFGFYVNNAPVSSGNIWFDDIFAQTTGGFTGSAPTVGTGATILGTNNLTFNAQGLGSINLNYDPTNALAGTGGLNIFNGGSANIFNVDDTGNASASGNLTLAGTNPTLKILNGQPFTIATSPGGDANLTTKFTLLNNGFLGLGTTTPGSLLDIMGGQVGIGTTAPLATLDLRGISGTKPAASISAQTSFAGLVVDNSGKGDLFTASSSGLTRFVVSQNGYVGIGTTTPLTSMHISRDVSPTTGLSINQEGNADLIIGGATNIHKQLRLSFDTTNNYGVIQSTVFGTSSNSLLLNPDGGNLGVGTTAPNAQLSLGTSVQTNKLYLYDNTNDKYGFGVATNTLQIYSGAGAGNNATIQFGKYDGNTLTEFMREQNGTLAIGSSSFLAQAGIDVEKNGLGNSIAVFNQTGSGDILTASSSGSTKFTIANNGTLTTSGGANINGTTTTTNLSDSGYASISASLAVGYSNANAGIGNAIFSGQVGIGTSSPTQQLSIAGNMSIYNTNTGRGDIYTTSNLDKIWNTTSLFNTSGTTFSSGMQNPAVNNQLNINPNGGSPLTGWSYRRAITVTNNAGTLTNYQVAVTINTASLISGGKMNSDCSDIRFTDSNGTTLLNYWIESGCNTSTTKIWILIPSISTTSYTIYVYYGKPSATSLSNIFNSFNNKGDDFSYPTLDTSRWVIASNSGTVSISGGQLKLDCQNGTNCDWWANTYLAPNAYITTPTGDWETRVKLGAYTVNNQNQNGLMLFQNSQNVYWWGRLRDDGSGRNGLYVEKVVGNAGTGSVCSVAGQQTLPMYLAIQKSGSNYAFMYSTDNTTWITACTISSLGITPVGIGVLEKKWGTGQGTTDGVYNNFYIRNFTASDPTTSVGAETGYFTSGLQSWTSDTLDAGSGNTYLPNYLTVNYTLDGSDNIPPKFQIEGSNTGSFAGEQTVFPGSSSYYQSGGSYPIASGTQLDVSSQITSRFRYWKVIAYMDTGATTTDTPTISSIELQDNKAALSMLASGFVGMGTTNPLAKLDVSDAQSSTVSAFIRNINAGATASGLAIQLGNTTPGASNYFLSFLDGAGDIIGKIQGNGAGGVSYATSGIDFAEYYKKASNAAELTPGTIICETPSGANACTINSSILGVVSNKAGFVGGTEHADDPSYVLVGMVGQLPVQISTTSGTIQQGDPLTVGPDGMAMKATTVGQIIGHALQNSSDAQNGMIMVAVNVSWYDPSFYPATLSQMPNASAAATLAGDLPLLTAQNATIAGDLTVLGKTTVSDLGITGNISDGLINMHGLDGSIETLAGDLNLQSDRLGGINILNGLVTIDTAGNITTQGILQAQSVEASTFVVQGNSSIGSASIPQGQTQVEIDTPAMSANDKVFITPTVLTTIPLIVTEKTNGKFVVQIATSQKDTVSFDWFIIKNK